MNKQEKLAWVMLILGAMALAYFVCKLLGLRPDATLGDLSPIVHNVIVMAMLILVTSQVAIQHSGTDLLEDERDLAIRASSVRAAHSFVLIALAAGSMVLGFGRLEWADRFNGVIAAQWAIVLVMASFVAQAVVQVVLYRRDRQA